MAKQPLKYDWIGEWFVGKTAERIGLALTIIFCLMCVPDMMAAFSYRCGTMARFVVVPRIWGTYTPVTKCDQLPQMGAH